MSEKLFRFRYEMYVNHLKWFSSECYPNGLVRDSFDDFSHNYVAVDDQGMIIGSIRITFDGPNGLPLETCNSLDGFRNGRVLAELGRLVINPGYNGNRLGSLLMKAGYQCAVERGANFIAIDVCIVNQDFYLKMGFVQVGDKYDDPFFNFKKPSVTMALDCITAQKKWPYTRPRLYRFFTSPDNRIVHEK